jgi:hypothetical protein
MLVSKLVALIEGHAEELTRQAVARVRTDERTSRYRTFSDDELEARARNVYAHLGRWLEVASEAEVEAEYYQLGARRRQEGVPLGQVVMALLLTRRTLWQFVESRGADSMLELRQQLDLELLVVRFFDRAIYHAVRGYEDEGSRRLFDELR